MGASLRVIGEVPQHSVYVFNDSGPHRVILNVLLRTMVLSMNQIDHTLKSHLAALSFQEATALCLNYAASGLAMWQIWAA